MDIEVGFRCFAWGHKRILPDSPATTLWQLTLSLSHLNRVSWFQFGHFSIPLSFQNRDFYPLLTMASDNTISPMTHQRSTPSLSGGSVDERDRKSLWAINLGLGLNILLAAAKT